MFLYRRSRLSYDVAMTGWLVGFLAVLSVTSAFSAAERGDRWRRERINIDADSEDQSPSTDGEGSRGLDGSPVAILANDVQRRSFDIDEYPRADKRMKVSDLRLKVKDIPEETSPEEEVDDKMQLTSDYVRIAGSTNASVHRPMTSSAGPLRAVVDILVVVDNELYRRALQRQKNNSDDAVEYIKKYYSYAISLMDSRYSQIQDSELTIRVRLADIFIAQNPSDSPWSEMHARQVKDKMALDPRVGLKKFREWLKEEHGKLPKFDHAIAFTGYSLITTDGGKIAGMAYLGRICKTADGSACSIIQEVGGLSSANTAAHELGHILGAKHDGEGSNGACPAAQNYIMTPGVKPEKEFLKNVFLFSQCTIREFKSVLSSEDGKCLFDSVADKISVLPGQVVSPDDQCKDVFGQDSGLCDLEETKSSEYVCTRLWCLDPSDALNCVSRTDLTPLLGTPCGDGKVCKEGQCLDKTAVLESMKGMEASAERSDRISTAQKRHHRSHTAIHKQVKQKAVDDRNARRTQARATARQSSIRQVRPMP